MHRLKLAIIILIIGVFISCKESTKDESESISASSIFDNMQKDARSSVVISGNLSHLFEANPLNTEGKEEYHQARFKLASGDGENDMPVRVAKRGITRKSICDFPPIKLKFYADSLKSSGYSKFNTYKLVTHCIDSLEELVLREYLTYKLYNHITDNSFRVQLVDITYQDESGSINPSPHHGFIIEEDEELANRLKTTLYEDPVKTIDRRQYAEMVVFQYMIGNTDWNLTGGHNMKWVKHRDLESPTPIPYDFDFCGLVNAPHAAPHPNMPIKKVRERFLQWRGKTKDELRPICDAFIADKENILNIIRDFTLLSQASRDDMTQYIETFFDQVENGDIE